MSRRYGVEVFDKKLAWLVGAVQGWHIANDRYLKLKDVPYWYNERACVSLLAGGAWLAGYVAMEEYSETKIYRNKNYPGRCDLYLSNKPHELAIEVKKETRKIPASLDGGKGLPATWQEIHKSAIDSARALPEKNVPRGALTFVTVYSYELVYSKIQREFESLVSELLSQESRLMLLSQKSGLIFWHSTDEKNFNADAGLWNDSITVGQLGLLTRLPVQG